MTQFILGVMEITLTMSVVIALLLLLSKLFGQRFSAKCRYFVWVIVAVRLCIPFGTAFLPSLIKVELPAEVTQSVTETAPVTNTVNDRPADTAPVQNTPVTVAPNVQHNTAQTQAPTVPESRDKPIEMPSVDTILTIAGYVWLAGAVVYLIISLSRYGFSIRGLRKTLTPASDETVMLYEKLYKKQKHRRAPVLYISTLVSSPMLYGYFKPRIVLPKIELTPNSFVGILAHELTHYRRRDLWVKLLCVLATSLHWFNPLVHIAAKRCNNEMELSCDESVLAGLDGDARLSYGNVMLDIIKRCRKQSGTLTTQFNPKKSAVRERFDNILDMTKKKRGVWIIVVIAVVCVIAGTVIGCSIVGNKPTLDITDTDNKAILSYLENNTDDIAIGKNEGDIIAASYELLGSDREKLYLYINKASYHENNGKAEETVGAVFLPVVLYAERNNSELVIIKHASPREGVYYGDDMKKLFPTDIIGLTSTVDTEVLSVKALLRANEKLGIDESAEAETDPIDIYTEENGISPELSPDDWVEGAPTIYQITAGEFDNYREIQKPDDMYTLQFTDVDDTELHIVTDSDGAPYVRGIDAKGQSISFNAPVELQGAYNFHVFEASDIVVFDKLYYNSGDTWALFDGGTYEMHNGYDSDGNMNEYFGVSLYKGDDGSLYHLTIANKYDGNLEQFGDECIISFITDRADVYSESGRVYIQPDGLSFSHETAVTISDKFDLNALFERNRDNMTGDYAGCNSIDDVIAVNKVKFGLVITEFTDESWAKLNYDGQIQEQCREFFYNFVSGKSDIPEYNALGITDWKITRKDELFNMFPSFIFEFTVTGDSLDALPPGHYVKYINDIRWTVMYDEVDIPTAQAQNTDNKNAQMVYTYLKSAYIWDIRNFGEWDGDIPVNYIIKQHGGDEMRYDDFVADAKRLFGIETIDDEKLGGHIYESDGIKMIQTGGTGSGFFADISEVNEVGGNYEVIVQLYADINGILPSHRLKYTLGKDGEFLRFEILKESLYEPEGLYRIYTK